MSEINWKNKYMALKAKFMESVDASFRLGYEQGSQDAQMESVMQQQQQQADEMQAQNQANQEGDPNQEQGGEEQEAQAPESANPAGSELDQHINELESMVKKGEMDMDSLMKAVNGFKDLKKNLEFKAEMKKSYEAIPAIAKALHKPKFKISVQANANMTDSAKKAVGMQEKIVSDIMKSWAEEETKTSKSIMNVLGVEGLIKKD